MPYIDQETRHALDDKLWAISEALNDKPQGVLTYVVSVLCYRWMMAGFIGTPIANYVKRSSALAALRDAEAECRRQFLDTYEDVKREENGGIY